MLLKLESRLLSEGVLPNAVCEADAGKQQGGQLIDFTRCFLSFSIHIRT